MTISRRHILAWTGKQYIKRTQVRSNGEWVPKYNTEPPAVSRRTAYRYVPVHPGIEREIFFKIKFVRDDGVIIDEDLIDNIEIHDDDPGVVEGGYMTHNPPILYIYNLREYYEYLTEAQIEKYEDQFYNLDRNGVRKDKRYNPDTGYWSFTGYQRPISEMWGETETDDLTKPTSPPSSKKYAKKWNGTEYIKQKTSGYYIRVLYTSGLRCVFRVLNAEEKEAKQLSRGYTYIDSEGVVHNEVSTYMVPRNLVKKPKRLIFRVPYRTATLESFYPDYVHYSYEDRNDADFSKPYVSVERLFATYFYSVDTHFWKKHTIKSSIPYVLTENILNFDWGLYTGFAALGQAPPYGNDIESISTNIIGRNLNFPYTTFDGSDGDSAEEEFPRTFDPVDISVPFSPITEEEYNEQEYQMDMTIEGGSHRVSVGREFTYFFNLSTVSLDENA